MVVWAATGGATVKMDKQYYKKQIENVLLNIEYYAKIVSTPHKEIIIKYSSSLKEHQSE